MNIFLYFTSERYRKHHWASVNLKRYRESPLWLFQREIFRMNLVMGKLCQRMYGDKILYGTKIRVPKLRL